MWQVGAPIASHARGSGCSESMVARQTRSHVPWRCLLCVACSQLASAFRSWPELVPQVGPWTDPSYPGADALDALLAVLFLLRGRRMDYLVLSSLDATHGICQPRMPAAVADGSEQPLGRGGRESVQPLGLLRRESVQPLLFGQEQRTGEALELAGELDRACKRRRCCRIRFRRLRRPSQAAWPCRILA